MIRRYPFYAGSGAAITAKSEDAIGLTEKEWSRIVQLIGGEWGQTEAEIIAWINDDESPTWQVEE